MAEDVKENAQAVFPSPSISTIYADVVVNVSHNASVVKFYLGRNDPSVSANVEQTRITDQVVMPVPSFINTFVFFERIVKGMVEQKLVTDEQLNRFREALEVVP
jgi:hypothetical protein